MDEQRVGRIIRALRRRLGWRQTDLAKRAACSQTIVSDAERGHLPSLSILRRIVGAMDASLVIEVRWRAGALDRLLDQDHAPLVNAVTELLAAAGWTVHVEATYSQFGERGSIDILAFQPSCGALLVVEIKTDLAAVEATLRKLDEKVRLAPKVASERYGWHARSVSRLLVMPESSTLRRRVERNAALFARAFPARGIGIRQWLRRPDAGLSGLWFLSLTAQAGVVRASGGPTRIRKPNRPSRAGGSDG